MFDKKKGGFNQSTGVVLRNWYKMNVKKIKGSYMLIKIFTILLFLITALASADIPTPPQNQKPSVTLPTEPLPPLPSSTDITQSYESSFLRVIVSVIGLIVLIIGTFWVLKRLGRGKFGKLHSDKSINIIERRPLSPKSVLYLVEVGNKRVLISESQFEVRSHAPIDLNKDMEKD